MGHLAAGDHTTAETGVIDAVVVVASGTTRSSVETGRLVQADDVVVVGDHQQVLAGEHRSEEGGTTGAHLRPTTQGTRLPAFVVLEVVQPAEVIEERPTTEAVHGHGCGKDNPAPQGIGIPV